MAKVEGFEVDTFISKLNGLLAPLKAKVKNAEEAVKTAEDELATAQAELELANKSIAESLGIKAEAPAKSGRKSRTAKEKTASDKPTFTGSDKDILAAIAKIVKADDKASRGNIADELGVAPDLTLSQKLKELVEAKEIKSQGAARGTHYVKA